MMTAERTVASRFEHSVHASMGTTDAAMLQAADATLPNAGDLTQPPQMEPKRMAKHLSLDSIVPPLDLRVLERRDSTTTSSSTSVPADDSEGSSDLDDDEMEPFGNDDTSGLNQFLVKPMSLLPVCPLDDIAVEEEKRRRRTVRMIKHDKNQRVHCPDAESLPSPTSPHGGNGSLQRRFTSNHVAAGNNSDVSRPQLSAQLLRRDSMAIRQQYWKQLGLSLPRRDLERNTGQRRPRHVGVKVRLNDSGASKSESKSIFQIISSWYSSDDKSTSRDSAPPVGVPTDPSETSTSVAKKAIRFSEEAELFYIPLHKDYSKRQRDCMWHTRTEFIAMVERNLDDVYDEMEREYEQQVAAEAAENDAMAKEEARQRACEAQLKAKAKAAAAAASPPLQSTPQHRTPLMSPASSPPMLALCPIATQIKVTPRARSPHDIRFKYLKHLGINNK